MATIKFYKSEPMCYSVSVFNTTTTPSTPEWQGDVLIASPTCLEDALSIIFNLSNVRVNGKKYKNETTAAAAINAIVK